MKRAIIKLTKIEAMTEANTKFIGKLKKLILSLLVIICVYGCGMANDSSSTDANLESVVKGHSYISEGATFILELKEDGTFALYDATSSLLTEGETPDGYDCEDDRIILRYANDEYVTFTFEDGKLIYQEKDSNYELPFRSTLEDGAVFSRDVPFVTWSAL